MSPHPDPSSAASTEPELQAVFDALLLMGGSRGAAGLALWLQAQGEIASAERFGQARVQLALRQLQQQGRIQLLGGRVYGVPPGAQAERLQALLLLPAARQYWQRLLYVYSDGQVHARQPMQWIGLRSADEAVRMLRLFMHSGVDLAAYQAQLRGPLLELSHAEVQAEALTEPWMPDALAALPAELSETLLRQTLKTLSADDPRRGQIRQWLLQQQQLAQAPQSLGAEARAQLTEARLQALDLAGARALLQGAPGESSGPEAVLVQAAERLAQGAWAEAAALFEQALKARRQASGQRRGLLERELARLYLVSLLAQPEPLAWAQARKFCIAESGSRKPSAHEWWGLWAHAIGVRLGEEGLDEPALAYIPGLEQRTHALDQACDRLLLAAWLGRPPAPGWTLAAAAALLQRLQAAEQHWQARLLAQAVARLELGELTTELRVHASPANWLGGPREAWRDALAAIAQLAEAQAAQTGISELAWQIELDAQGRVQNILPFERSRGARGQLKLKPVTLSKLKKQGQSSSARDNAVLRHIERSIYSAANSYELDVSQAAIALVGHPALMFADAPGQWVELVEALPELEVRQGGDGAYAFHIHPPLLCSEPPRLSVWYGSRHEAEVEKRNSLRVLRDGPAHARLLRISPTQRRVAELVNQGWTVPAKAGAELGAALQVLSGHFQLHSDAAAGRAVAGDSRLRARLSPLGEGLQLQLVAQPFGGFGPAVTPGAGRARLLCMHEGLSLATERDLAAEAEHRRAVLEAMPFLDPELPPDLPWLLSEPEEALRAVELLPGLPGIAALDWPKGKPLRVTALASSGVRVQVHSARNWLALQGEAQLDEQRVLGLQELMQLARASRSRYVRLAEGEYLALSEQLRQQLRDLDALAVAKKEQLQLPPASASWLDETLAEMQLAGDAPWRARMDALAAAAALQPAVPAGLRAELRGYQEEGYAWMARLAAAGLGACLADDMGLGKTVQTLALLIARAEQGPALVLAPTSVCANWLAEGEVFAPGLKLALYGSAGERAAQIAAAGPGDVLIASYALAQNDAELFAAKDWASLVLDEAQALKNAATKRAKSVAEFKAGFKLALSGTPVENRLADLWSIMQLINPGLLGTAAQFAERFANPIEKQQDAAARQRLRRLVSPFLLRRTKAQVLQDLPPRTEIVHLVQPGSEERSFLEALRRDAQASVAAAAQAQQGGPAIQVLAELMRLRRAACDPRLVAPELGLVGAKLGEFEALVRELVDGAHKALVFSQFTDYLGLLAERLDAMGVRYQYLDGSTPAAARAQRVAAFQRGEGEVFLISLKAGGFGLNLTMADYVLIVDPWWNPAAEDQAMGRAHRMGQQRPVTVYRLVTAGSVEERIIELHRDKRGLAEGILEGQDEAKVLDAAALSALLMDSD
ncbi:DEAD/DEAH box helicase [Paucibacter soli]|uniref:DEAD/DEAH box helicase n=1 Tax=Paucibacter soli TaxID=3133433 RepID=UPI00309BA0F5